MEYQRRGNTMGTGEFGSNGDALPLHLNDGLDYWGCEDSSSSNSNSVDSDTDTDSDAETYVTKPAAETNGHDAYTSFVLELQRSMTFGKSTAGQRWFRTERDAEHESFLDGCTIVIDEHDGPECLKADEDERTQTTLLEDGFTVVELDSDESSDDDSYSDDSSYETPREHKYVASYFWRRRRYVMRRRVILCLLVMLTLVFGVLLGFKLVDVSWDGSIFGIRNSSANNIANSIEQRVQMTTIWDVDTHNMGV